jgi:hypothetical protein
VPQARPQLRLRQAARLAVLAVIVAPSVAAPAYAGPSPQWWMSNGSLKEGTRGIGGEDAFRPET